MAIPYNSNYLETVPFSDVCAQFALDSGAELTFTIPGSATQNYRCEFHYNSTSNIFVRLNGTVTVPGAGTVTTQQYNEFRTEIKYVKGGDVIHVITPDTTAYMSLSLMSLN